MHKDYDNIIFDLGDVLLDYRWKEMLMDYGFSENEAIRLGRQLFDNELWSKFDEGIYSEEEIVKAYVELYPQDKDAIEFFIYHSEYMHKPRIKVWRKLEELKKAGYKLYLLSNYPENMFKKHTQYADFMPFLDGVLVSYQVNLLKPDLAIYKALIEKYELNPIRSIFFDDRQKNVEGARAAGLASERVLSEDALIQMLDKFL